MESGFSKSTKNEINVEFLQLCEKGISLKDLKRMLEQGADPNYRIDKKTPFQQFCKKTTTRKDMSEMLKLMLEHGAKPNDKLDYETAFHTAIRSCGNHDILQNTEKILFVLKVMLENGADPNVGDNQGNTPFHAAITTCFFMCQNKPELINEILPDVVQILLDNKADPNIKNKDGLTPFYFLLRLYYRESNKDNDMANIEILSSMLKANADPNIKNDVGETLFHKLCNTKDNVQILSLILKYNADPNIKNDRGETPLHYFFTKGTKVDYGILFIMLENNADFNIPIPYKYSNASNTPFETLLMREDFGAKRLKQFLDNGYKFPNNTLNLNLVNTKNKKDVALLAVLNGIAINSDINYNSQFIPDRENLRTLLFNKLDKCLSLLTKENKEKFNTLLLSCKEKLPTKIPKPIMKMIFFQYIESLAEKHKPSLGNK